MSADAIRFIIDGQIHSVSGIDPNMTVLNYLREHLHKTGTKEGCAEGDCGACTVVVGELHEGRVRFRALNSCIQFIATLNGKALFTVESLRSVDGTLHPVQRAMVEKHGSQCGFCTPGFVMSLFAMYRSEPAGSRQRIQDVLAGNLCRCTGYRPIIDAAMRMYDMEIAQDADWLQRPCSATEAIPAGEQALIAQLSSIGKSESLALSGRGPAGERRRFYAPTSTAELAELLQQYPDAQLLAGGTDIGLWVTKDHADLEQVIYVGAVDELRTIKVGATMLDIGAGTNLSDLEDLLGRLYPDLAEILRRFASPPIRNAATLGGNIANASPIGDSMPALIALGSSLVLRKGDTRRELSLDEFFLDYRKTALGRGEFIERVQIPVSENQHFAAYKISKRFDQDISALLAAFCLKLDDNKVENICICFGGMAATPQRARQCEKFLRGKSWTEANISSAVHKLDDDYQPISDMRASAGYRQQVAHNLLMKFFLETSGAAHPTRVLNYANEAAP